MKTCFTGAFGPINRLLERAKFCATADQVNGILGSRFLLYAFFTDTVLDTGFQFMCRDHWTPDWAMSIPLLAPNL